MMTPPKVRVLQAMAGAAKGGAEAFFERLAGAFERAGLDQAVVIRDDAERAARLRDAGVPPMELPFGGRLDLLTTANLKVLIRTFKPDLVLTWMNRASRMCPKGDFVHVARLGGYYDLKYYRNCDHLVGNTKDIIDYLVREGWPAERAHYLPNFVDDLDAEPEPRAAHGTPEGAPLLVAMGRLHKNKAFDVLIEALQDVPDAWLWLAGEGPLRDVLEETARQCGVADRVVFLGWRTDVGPLLAAADVLVVPSRHEPLGNVVIEGWSARRPVVAAASQGPTQLIRDGETGLLAPVDDADAMATALNRVIGDKALGEALVSAGRDAFEADFTERAVVRRYFDFFEQVAG